MHFRPASPPWLISAARRGIPMPAAPAATSPVAAGRIGGAFPHTCSARALRAHPQRAGEGRTRNSRLSRNSMGGGGPWRCASRGVAVAAFLLAPMAPIGGGSHDQSPIPQLPSRIPIPRAQQGPWHGRGCELRLPCRHSDPHYYWHGMEQHMPPCTRPIYLSGYPAYHPTHTK